MTQKSLSSSGQYISSVIQVTPSLIDKELENKTVLEFENASPLKSNKSMMFPKGKLLSQSKFCCEPLICFTLAHTGVYYSSLSPASSLGGSEHR